MALSFVSGAFDLVVTTDVFEHVRHPYVAFAEVFRVLRRGGVHVFTVPGSYPLPQHTVERVDVRSEQDVFILEPVYHHGTELVYNDFGADFTERLAEIGFETEVTCFDLPNHSASTQLTFSSRKPRWRHQWSFRHYIQKRPSLEGDPSSTGQYVWNRHVYPDELTIDVLESRACHRSGLADFGDSAYREGFAVLLQALHDEAGLSEQGRASCAETLTRHLVTRLKMTAFLGEHSEAQAAPVEAPIFIVSLGRIGTTLLHSLLAQDESTRTLEAWEAADPLPPPEASTDATDARRQRHAFEAALVEAAVPELPAMFDLAVEDLPADDSQLLAVTGRDLGWTVLCRVPTYREWLKGCDMTGAYRAHRGLLSILQSRMPRRRWLLQSTSHLLALDALLDTYDDAVLIALHRDPSEVVASSASLATHLRALYSNEATPQECGEDALMGIADGAQWYEEFRTRRPDQRCIDIDVATLLDDPVGTVRMIYAGIDAELSVDAEDKMHRWIDEHPRGRHGDHRYSLEEYGLDRRDIESRLGWYRERFCERQ